MAKDKLNYKLRLSDLKPMGIGLDEYQGRCAREMNSLENLQTFNKYDNRTFVLRLYNMGLITGLLFTSVGLGKLLFE